MSTLKHAWPYIQYLSEQERAEYESDLPENPDDIKVHHIIPSERYVDRTHLDFVSKAYLTPKEYELRTRIFTNEALWFSLYVSSVTATLWSSTYWYNTNIITNYIYFKNESWARYGRLRFWFVFTSAWTCWHLLWHKGSFENYPKIIR